MGGESKVGDFVTLQRGTTYKGRLVGEPGPALLGLGSIVPGGGFREGDYKTYGGDCPQKLMLYPGDLFASLKGATKDGKMIGSVARVPESVPSGRLTQDTVKLEFENSDKEFSNYLYWVLRTPQYRDYCDRHATGSAVVALSRDDFLNYPVPSLNATRKRIVSLLEFIEYKIELNRQMNATLEAMAQALFKSWFVDFDPVIDNALAAGNPIPEELQARADARTALGDKRKPLPEGIQKQFPSRFVFTEEMGWVPEGWTLVKLGDYVTVKRGGSPRPIHDYLAENGLPWVKISDATASSSRFVMSTKQFIKPEGLKKTVLLKKGELILSNSATPGLPKFLNLDACIHDGWLFFPKKRSFGDLYLYQLFLVVRSDLLLQGNGSVFTNLKTDILKNHLVVMPGESMLNEIETQLSAIHRKSLLLQEEIESLMATRDSLLPKLLSGELRIPDADKLAAEAV